MKTLRLSYLLLSFACALGAWRVHAAASGTEITFEFWADDGARLKIDGQTLIDDWRPCAENTPDSHRIVKVTLTPGYHRLVAEYFNGESLDENDADPAKLYWNMPHDKKQRTIVPASAFTHTQDDEKDYQGTGVSLVASGSMKPGLAAHYFKDPLEWDGRWMPHSVPKVDAKDWTFRQYVYSRNEPLINHLFIRRGWFSIRWVGYLKVPGDSNPGGGDAPQAPPSTSTPHDPPGHINPPGKPPVTPPVNRPPVKPPSPSSDPTGPAQKSPHPGNGGQHGNNGLGNGIDPAPPGNPPTNDGAGTSPGNPGNKPVKGGTVGGIQKPVPGNGKIGPKGNNGLGNGVDPAPPGNPPPNDVPGTSPSDPGNKQHGK